MPRAAAKPREVKKVEPTGLPAAIQQAAQSQAGAGVSTDKADVLVPLVYVLQSNSPQCLRGGPEHVDGAEPGSLWLRNAPGQQLVSGEDGFLFQPCAFWKNWVEWGPRGSGVGLVAQHEEPTSDSEWVPDPRKPQREILVRPSGNQLIETRYHAGLVHGVSSFPLAYVMPMSSTGHTASRAWMFMMSSKRLPDSGAVAPSFAGLYRVKTRLRSNPDGDWFAVDVEDAGWVQSMEVYELGAELNEAFESGRKQADVDDSAAGAGEQAGQVI